MFIIILDTKTALSGAITGVQLCISTIIPSLFPFIFLSGMLNHYFLGRNMGILSFLGRFCKIPKGAESLLLVGFLAGYPVGAQGITQAYRDGTLSSVTAKRMLGFCNNAGPAFLFGIFPAILSNGIIPWVLWLIHILSALFVGLLLPSESESLCQISNTQQITIHNALENAIKVISVICGWVIIFRIVINFCDRWFFGLVQVEIQVLIAGLLELSNGCIMLQRIPEEGIRFILACPMLAFGGVCIGMQTSSVTSGLGTGYYFPGKVLHALFSLLLAMFLHPIFFQNQIFPHPIPIIILIMFAIGIILLALYRKKLWHLWKECCIIPLTVRRKEQIYAVSKENNTRV